MTFLKRLGQIIVKGGALALGIAPMLKLTLPQQAGTIETVSRDLAQISEIVVTIEAVGAALGLKGEDKLHAAAPLVAQLILQSSLVAGHPLADPVLFHEGVTDITNGVVKILNARADTLV